MKQHVTVWKVNPNLKNLIVVLVKTMFALKDTIL